MCYNVRNELPQFCLKYLSCNYQLQPPAPYLLVSKGYLSNHFYKNCYGVEKGFSEDGYEHFYEHLLI